MHDEAIAVFDQESQQGEHLGLDVARLPVEPQLDPERVELEFAEPIDHEIQRSSSTRRLPKTSRLSPDHLQA